MKLGSENSTDAIAQCMHSVNTKKDDVGLINIVGMNFCLLRRMATQFTNPIKLRFSFDFIIFGNSFHFRGIHHIVINKTEEAEKTTAAATTHFLP